METDKKLTTKKRKSLPDSAFCGPNRSFPAHDCSHIKTGLSMLGRYKGPGSKEKIRACLYRKARSKGCFKSGPGSKNSKDFIQTEMLEDIRCMVKDGMLSKEEGMIFLVDTCNTEGLNLQQVTSIMDHVFKVSLDDGFSHLITLINASRASQ